MRTDEGFPTTRYLNVDPAPGSPGASWCKHPITSSLKYGLMYQVRGNRRRHNAATGGDRRFATMVFMS